MGEVAMYVLVQFDEHNSWPNSKSIQLQSPESNDQIKILSEESSSLAQVWMTVSLYNFAYVSTIQFQA